MVEFDWKHPKKIDRRQIEGLFDLSFIEEHDNVVVVGPNGVGKTMLAQNLTYEAVTRGHPARFVAASEMLNDLASVDGSTRQHRFKRYVSPRLLTIDEVGYLRYDTRHADLLYEVVRQRYEAERSIIITTNKAFAEWNQVFDSPQQQESRQSIVPRAFWPVADHPEGPPARLLAPVAGLLQSWGMVSGSGVWTVHL